MDERDEFDDALVEAKAKANRLIDVLAAKHGMKASVVADLRAQVDAKCTGLTYEDLLERRKGDQ